MASRKGAVHDNGGFRIPQAKKLTIIQETRKLHRVEYSNQQLSLALQQARETPRRSQSMVALQGPLCLANSSPPRNESNHHLPKPPRA
jgi:hypothetical protein